MDLYRCLKAALCRQRGQDPAPSSHCTMIGPSLCTAGGVPQSLRLSPRTAPHALGACSSSPLWVLSVQAASGRDKAQSQDSNLNSRSGGHCGSSLPEHCCCRQVPNREA